MTGGIAFGFRREKKEKLLNGYRFLQFNSNNKIKSIDKYLYFYNQQRNFGELIHKIEGT